MPSLASLARRRGDGTPRGDDELARRRALGEPAADGYERRVSASMVAPTQEEAAAAAAYARAGESSLLEHMRDARFGEGGRAETPRKDGHARSASALRWQDTKGREGYVADTARQELDVESQFRNVPAGAVWRGEALLDNRVRHKQLHKNPGDLDHDVNIRAHARIANARGTAPAKGSMYPGRLGKAMEEHLAAALADEDADAESVVSRTTVSKSEARLRVEVASCSVQTQGDVLARAALRTPDRKHGTPRVPQLDLGATTATQQANFQDTFEPRPILWAPRAVQGFSRKLIDRVAEAEREAMIARYNAESHKMKFGEAREASKDGDGKDGKDGKRGNDVVDRREHEMLQREQDKLLAYMRDLFTSREYLREYEAGLRRIIAEKNLDYTSMHEALRCCEHALEYLCSRIHVDTCATLLVPETFPWTSADDKAEDVEHFACVAAAVKPIGAKKFILESAAPSGRRFDLPETSRPREDKVTLKVINAICDRMDANRVAPSSSPFTTWDMAVDTMTPCYELEEAEHAFCLAEDFLGRVGAPNDMRVMACPVFAPIRLPPNKFKGKSAKQCNDIVDDAFYEFRARRKRAGLHLNGGEVDQAQLRKDNMAAGEDPEQVAVITLHNFPPDNAFTAGYVEELAAVTGRVIGEALGKYRGHSNDVVENAKALNSDNLSEEHDEGLAELIALQAELRAQILQLMEMIRSAAFKRALEEMLRYRKPPSGVVELILASLTVSDATLLVPEASGFKKAESIRPKPKKKSKSRGQTPRDTPRRGIDVARELQGAAEGSESKPSTARTLSTPRDPDGKAMYVTPCGKPINTSFRAFALDAHFMAVYVDKNLNNAKLVESTWEVLRKQPIMQVNEMIRLFETCNVVDDLDDGKYLNRLHKHAKHIIADLSEEKVKRTSTVLVLLYSWCQAMLSMRVIYPMP